MTIQRKGNVMREDNEVDIDKALDELEKRLDKIEKDLNDWLPWQQPSPDHA